MQGGHNPDLGIEWYEDLFRSIKARYPIHLHALSPSEIQHVARKAQADVVRGALAAARRRPRLAARRRRRDPGRPRAQDHLAQEDDLRTSGSRSWRRPSAGHEHHGDHDVGPRRDARRARRAPAPDPRPAGRDARLPGIHLMDVPARQHGARAAGDGGTPTSFDYLLMQAVSPHLPRQRRAHPVSWVTQGMKIGQVALGLRRRRHGLDHDRGERGLGRRHHLPRLHRGLRPHHSQRRAIGPASATRSTAPYATTRRDRR